MQAALRARRWFFGAAAWNRQNSHKAAGLVYGLLRRPELRKRLQLLAGISFFRRLASSPQHQNETKNCAQGHASVLLGLPGTRRSKASEDCTCVKIAGLSQSRTAARNKLQAWRQRPSSTNT